MCKKILLTFMVLMGAMSSWAGQVILDPQYFQDPASYHGNIGVDNDWPAPGATVTLNVVPDGGYCLYISNIVIEEYDANDDYVGPITPSGPPEAYGPEDYTFEMPTDATHNVQVTVTFTGMEYPVNCIPTSNGTFCVSHINGVPIDPDIWNNHACTGDTVTLTATPDPGWELVNYSVFAPNLNDSVQVDPNTGDFIMPPSPVDIEATFRQIDYTINIDLRNGNGSIDVSVIAGVDQSNNNPPYLAHKDDLIELMISPDPDYELDFIDIEAEDTVYNRRFSGDIFDMPPSNITLVPTFRPVSYMVEIDQGIPHGSVAALNTSTGIGGPGVPTVPAEVGQNIQLSNTPDIGYELDHYEATNASNGTDVLFTDGQNGASTSVNGFNMPSGNVVVTAIFKKKDYKISIDLSLAGGNGTIDVFKIDENVVPPGTPQPYYAKMDVPIELTITPAPGYELDYIDIVADDPLYSNYGVNWDGFDMPPSNITLRPTFRVATYNINVDQSILDGTVKAYNIPDGFGYVPTVPAEMGENIQLSNTPDPGYRFDYYIVTNATDGSDVLFSDNNPGQTTNVSDFFMPGNDVNVSAVFVPNDYPITLVVLPNAAAGNVNVPPTGVYGDQIPINIQPNAGYTISQVYYEYRQGSQTVRINVAHDPLDPPDQYFFTMPAYHVTVTVVFDPDPHNLNVVTFYTGGSITVDKIDGLPQTPYQPNFYPVGTGAVVDVINTPNTGYRFVAYVLTSDADNPGYQVTFTTNSFTMPPLNVNLSAKFELNQHKVVVQNDPHGTAEAWWGSIPAFDNAARIYNPIDYDGFVSLNVTACNIGYVFDHYELYDLANYPGPQLLGLWQNPPDNTDFLMPDCDVLVVPVFLPIDYNLTVDMTNWWGGWISAQDMAVVPPMTPIKSGADWYDTPYPMPAATYPYAHIGDVIQLNNGRDWNPIYADITFSYYVLTRSDDGAFIGEMTQNEFTMPPCGVIIGAQFHDDNYGIPPTYPVANWAWVTGRGRVLLHMETWLAKSKSSPDEEEQDTDLYGFARAVPGEPMHFVVQPNPGYQVKKNDITVRLLDVSQGEGGDEGKVLKEFKGGDGIEIFGPDELVTELTDYYFIFDVPEGVAPYDVKVEIYADFTPVDYTITVDGAIEHGTVAAPTSAKVDEVVTLTVTPEPGYRLESITVTPEEPGYLVTVDSNNQFVMPPCNVTVTATFIEANFLRGDANGDNEVSIADVSALIDYLLSGDESLINMDAADCNGDDSITIADVSALIDYLLFETW